MLRPIRVVLPALLLCLAACTMAQEARSLTSPTLVASWPVTSPAMSSTDPSTWGSAVLSPLEHDKVPAPSLREINVPRSEYAARLDGLIGSDWEDGVRLVADGPGSRPLHIYAKHTGGMLYVAAGLPQEALIPKGARVEIVVEDPATASPELAPGCRLYSLESTSSQGKRVLRVGTARAGGNWRLSKTAPDGRRPPEKASGQWGLGGDGLRAYAVFELAVPVNGPTAENQSAAPIGFALRVTLPRSETALTDKRLVGTQRCQWPLGPGPDMLSDTSVFGHRPDLWGRAIMGMEPKGDDCIWVPRSERSVTIDGEIGADEWADADSRSIALSSDAQITVRTMRVGDDLYVAVGARGMTARRAVSDVSLYLDPLGDQGIEPRGDDRALRLTGANASLVLQALSWNRDKMRWDPTGSVTWEASASSRSVGDGHESGVEFRVDLSSLGWQGPSERDQTLGVAAEISVTAGPARVVGVGEVEVTPEGMKPTRAPEGQGRPSMLDDPRGWAAQMSAGTPWNTGRR